MVVVVVVVMVVVVVVVVVAAGAGMELAALIRCRTPAVRTGGAAWQQTSQLSQRARAAGQRRRRRFQLGSRRLRGCRCPRRLVVP